MKVKVQLFAQLGHVAGQPSVDVELDGPATAQDLLGILSRRLGDEFGKLVLDGERRIRPSVLFFVEGSQVDWDAPRQLCDGDEVFLSLPISGG